MKAQSGSSTGDASGTRERPGDRQLFTLIRFSHIFSAAVREILETKLLREVCGEPVTVLQFHLLRFIAGRSDHQVHDVADFLGVTPPAATKMLDRLERRGLVVRRPSGDDRRVTLLSASAHGEETLALYEHREREQILAALSGFSEKELSDLTRALEAYSLALIGGAGDPAHCLRCAAWVDADCPVQNLQPACPYRGRTPQEM